MAPARCIRAEVDTDNSRMNAKIRTAQGQKIPWMLIAGDRDVEANAVSVRLRTGEDLGAIPVDKFIRRAADIVNSKSQALS